jgi:2-dehydro-3-deoxyphosphogluconate aldolase/(4S)-4-hydroxy-2-oxoglutarate aldolase
VEITLRTPAGLEAVRAAAAEAPEAVVGAGTCLTEADLDAAHQAGAAFAVSPGAPPALLEHARDLRLPYLPGVATPTELMAGLECGYRMFKFFPAVPAGGLAYLKALAGPFPTVRFCPTGGITLQTARDFLALKTVPCLGGSWLAPDEAVVHGDWGRIEALAREAVAGLG